MAKWAEWIYLIIYDTSLKRIETDPLLLGMGTNTAMGLVSKAYWMKLFPITIRSPSVTA
jgi:hypothetical protein